MFAYWCDTFVESILNLSQKCTEEWSVITLKNDAKFEMKLTCALKSDMTNFMVLKGNVIFEEKLTGGLKNDMQNLINAYDEKMFDNFLGWSLFYS